MPARQSAEEITAGSSLWTYNQLLVLVCLVGLGLSLYAYSEEMMMQENNNYKPFCDVNSQVSCSKAFNSPYGKGFGLFGEGSIFHKPNSFFGIVFYSMVATLSFVNSPVAVNASLILIVLSNFVSMYFAYILYFVLQNLCIVCIATYLVNITNLIIIMKKHDKIKMINSLIEKYEQQKSELKKKAE